MVYCAFTSEYGSCALCVNVSTARVKSVCRKSLTIASGDHPALRTDRACKMQRNDFKSGCLIWTEHVHESVVRLKCKKDVVSQFAVHELKNGNQVKLVNAFACISIALSHIEQIRIICHCTKSLAEH